MEHFWPFWSEQSLSSVYFIVEDVEVQGSAGFTFVRALGQDEIQGPQHRLIFRKIINMGRNFKQL